MSNKQTAVKTQGVNTANSLTELAALLAMFAKQNPAIQAELATILAPKVEGKKKAETPKKDGLLTFKGINVTEDYLNKSDREKGRTTGKSFLVYGEGTKALKDKLASLGGRFNVFFVASLGGSFKGWNFKKEDRDKVLKAIK